MKLSKEQVKVFRKALLDHYAASGRHELSWRQTDDPYRIIVSELMLQQTQVPRVVPKYHEFLEKFPDVRSLARAPLSDVLIVWQGLGYNRRAKFLWETARLIDQNGGGFPDTIEGLIRLPGIGPNTAGAIMAYAYNHPVLFVETNIRTVYIHHFFADRSGVADKQIIELVEQTIDQTDPRTFYWALMDYGSHLKASGQKLNARSKHYSTQSPFEGSRRQVRGAALRVLAGRSCARDELIRRLGDPRAESVINDLQSEGLIRQTGGVCHLA
jgi:A/G-specific adenine glycosylase